jgi:methylglyoxal synthase
MKQTKTSSRAKRIAIVVDESKRTNLIEWSYFNKEILSQHQIIAYESTGRLLKGTLDKHINILPGTDGDGNQQLAQMIMNENIDILILLNDAGKVKNGLGMSDLLGIAREKNIIVACNQATSDMVITSLYISGVDQTDQTQSSSNITEEVPYSNNKHDLNHLRFAS